MTVTLQRDLAHASVERAWFDKLRVERDLLHAVDGRWAFRAAETAGKALPYPIVARYDGEHTREFVCADDALVAHVTVQAADRSLYVQVAAATSADAARALERIRDALPPAETPEGDTIPVAFWTYSPHGPHAILRDLDAPAWRDIVANYPSATIDRLAALFGDDFRPGHGGQFVLWHGPPGTGKTTAIRSLAREWRGWCDLHYVADPDRFFGDHADYLLDVLLRETTDSPGRQSVDPRWRLLVFEDTGELLHADAKERIGQALSRFLNTVDGMIGQGLRVLALITTNEPLGKLHAAVTRPGRSALTVEFKPFEPVEAARWLAAHDIRAAVPNHRTLAELYAELNDFAERGARAQHVGFAA